MPTPPKRNRYKPTDEERSQVRAMIGFGLTIDQVALVLVRGQATVRRHFKAEIKDGQTVANAKVAQTLYRIATQEGADKKPIGNSAQVQAAIFWMKVRARWSTLENVHVSGIPSSHELADLRNLSADDLRALERIARRLETPGHRPEESPAGRTEGEPGRVPSAN